MKKHFVSRRDVSEDRAWSPWLRGIDEAARDSGPVTCATLVALARVAGVRRAPGGYTAASPPAFRRLPRDACVSDALLSP